MKSIQLYILEFDSNGYPVSVSPYDVYASNGRTIGGTINLTKGSSDDYTNNLFFEANCEKYKTIISKIVFMDDEEWDNPYLYEWIIVNKDNY